MGRTPRQAIEQGRIADEKLRAFCALHPPKPIVYDLLPCPFCGSSDIQISSTAPCSGFGEYVDQARAECQNCGGAGEVIDGYCHCTSSNKELAEIAVKKWNTRKK